MRFCLFAFALLLLAACSSDNRGNNPAYYVYFASEKSIHAVDLDSPEPSAIKIADLNDGSSLIRGEHTWIVQQKDKEGRVIPKRGIIFFADHQFWGLDFEAEKLTSPRRLSNASIPQLCRLIVFPAEILFEPSNSDGVCPGFNAIAQWRRLDLNTASEAPPQVVTNFPTNDIAHAALNLSSGQVYYLTWTALSGVRVLDHDLTILKELGEISALGPYVASDNNGHTLFDGWDRQNQSSVYFFSVANSTLVKLEQFSHLTEVKWAPDLKIFLGLAVDKNTKQQGLVKVGLDGKAEKIIDLPSTGPYLSALSRSGSIVVYMLRNESDIPSQTAYWIDINSPDRQRHEIYRSNLYAAPFMHQGSWVGFDCSPCIINGEQYALGTGVRWTEDGAIELRANSAWVRGRYGIEESPYLVFSNTEGALNTAHLAMQTSDSRSLKVIAKLDIADTAPLPIGSVHQLGRRHDLYTYPADTEYRIGLIDRQQHHLRLPAPNTESQWMGDPRFLSYKNSP